MTKRPTQIPAIKVHQWMQDWDKVDFDSDERRREPEHHFYVFSISAVDLLSLSSIPRRSTTGRVLGEPDLGIQRRHDPKRSRAIRDYVRLGYPWSEMTPTKRASSEFKGFRKPGWLPTAIVVNILASDDQRGEFAVDPDDLIKVENVNSSSSILRMPDNWPTEVDWKPKQLAPIEVIDGQHRLLAFEEDGFGLDMELPVVAFYGLDISWQAYLFWTINIRPKRINPSLAFDLYPLLRTESWLEAEEGHSIYRDTRSQELTEALWAYPSSVWYRRIDMLGEQHGVVSQAAWVRSLAASYVKPWESARIPIGGLFGARLQLNREALPWSRAQQAAFLIAVWGEVATAVHSSDHDWSNGLRGTSRKSGSPLKDPAFSGAHTLLNTDQGVRAVLQVTNDLCFVRAEKLNLNRWRSDDSEIGADDHSVSEEAIDSALRTFKRQPIAEYLKSLAEGLATYDWRSSSASGLPEELFVTKLGFRGSGGYRELRRQLLLHLSKCDGEVGLAAAEVHGILGY
ncbi:MAG: DGQHR domain-containing protein [Pirellula sp.]